MTPQEQLAFIKQKVIEAVPSIKDLVFGCQIEQTIAGKKHIDTVARVVVHKTYKIEEKEIFLISGKLLSKYIKYEIIGRPITLPDVLFAILRKNVLAEKNEEPPIWKVNEKTIKLIELWNLLLPLDGQSEEVWAFLAELLV